MFGSPYKFAPSGGRGVGKNEGSIKIDRDMIFVAGVSIFLSMIIGLLKLNVYTLNTLYKS